MTAYPRPPAHVEAYVRILGFEDAVLFLTHFGGGELYIPRRNAASSAIADLLGEAAAERLGAAADRLPRRVPTAKPWLAEVLRWQGLSATEIARKMHVSDVAVRGWLNKADTRKPKPRPDNGQLPLI